MARAGSSLPAADGEGVVDLLQDVDRRPDLARHRHQRVFLVVAEAQVLAAFGEEHADQPPERLDGHCELAARFGEARQRDLGLEGRTFAQRCLAHRTPVRVFGGRVPDADRRTLACRHAHHAVPHRNLGAHARVGITQARKRVEMRAAWVEHEHESTSACSMPNCTRMASSVVSSNASSLVAAERRWAHVRTAHSKLRRGGGGNVAPGRRSISSTAYTSEP
jgi:hypothetical protein